MKGIKNTFGINIIPSDDAERLAALKRYDILDTPPEDAFDRVAELARNIFQVPIALVALVDEYRVFFKANKGMEGTKEVNRGVSLCSLAILNKEVTVFENAVLEPCLLKNPLVAGTFGLKFYAGAPVTTLDGHRVGTVCIVDKKIRQFSEEDKVVLQQLASIITDELELRRSAIKALEHQKELLQLTSHDLKAPLNNISGLAKLIENTPNNEAKVVKSAQLVQRSVELLQGVINQLVDASLDFGTTYKIVEKQVNISHLLSNTLKIFEPSFLEKKLILHSHIQPDIVIMGDELRLRVMYENLISNAIKYSPEGKSVTVNLLQQEQQILFEICDEGVGISADEIGKLFGKYVKLKARPTGNETSSGLGLYITKQIVEQHRGRIWAKSEGADKGCIFCVELAA